MKLSELKKIAEEKGISLDELIDDETGVSFRDMRGRYTAYDNLQKDHDLVKQKFEAQGHELTNALGQVQQAQNWIQQQRANAQQTMQNPQATQAQFDRAWRMDQLLAPIASEVDYLHKTIVTTAEAVAAAY